LEVPAGDDTTKRWDINTFLVLNIGVWVVAATENAWCSTRRWRDTWSETWWSGNSWSGRSGRFDWWATTVLRIDLQIFTDQTTPLNCQITVIAVEAFIANTPGGVVVNVPARDDTTKFRDIDRLPKVN